MSEDLIARLLRWADGDDETLMGKRKPDQTSLKRLAAARIAELEAELAEARSTERIQCEQMHPDAEGWSEWVHPLPGYLMQCCDCDLIHEMEFCITPRDDELNTGPLNEGEGEHVILFRAKRHEPSDHVRPDPSTRV